jgi:type IX secretion system PorP/SprF family membrane protein
MKKYFALLAITASVTVSAQDFHLAQYDIANLYMNPGTTGMFQGEPGSYRITADYRAQWRSLGMKPFNTQFISFDMPLNKWDQKWGVGGFIMNNHANPGLFRTMQVMASGAYNIMNTSREHYLTAGLQMGIIYKSVNQGEYSFDEQYDPSTASFNTTLEDGENFARMNRVGFDAAVGIHYKYVAPFEDYHPFGSFSIQHLPKPNESLTGTKSKMPMRFNLMGGCDFQLKEDFMLSPRFLYMNQIRASEINVGVLGYYTIKNSNLDAIFGADYRHKDAIIAHLGFRQGKSIFRFSYDINISGLSGYTNNRGAWEFSLLLVGVKDQPLFKPIF